jgi:hypothetical protein
MLTRPVFAVVLAGLVAAGCDDPSVEQHGVVFRPVRQGSNQLWITEIERDGARATLPFYYLPDETADVVLEAGLLVKLGASDFRPRQLYVSIDPDAHHYTFTAGAEIGRFVEDLGLFGGPEVQMAFSKANDRPEQLPVVDCSKASPDTAVIVVEQGGRNEVKHDGACVRATYLVPQDSLRVADRFCYGLAGVL